MEDLNSKISAIRKLIISIDKHNGYGHKDDTRSITIDLLSKTSQNYFFSLIFSKNLCDLNYCKNNFTNDIVFSDLVDLQYNYDGFIKNAFFIHFFIYIETHIRLIAKKYELKKDEINVISITKTFENLIDKNKSSLFQNITQKDKKLFEFFCFLRNTMHNGGIHHRDDQSIEINDKNSIFNCNKILLELKKGKPNSMKFNDLLLLNEQMVNLILKINLMIPETDLINHSFLDLGYND